jgi:hypothetical protein
LPQGFYDITLMSPDGQSTVLSEAFQVEDPVSMQGELLSNVVRRYP